jgi:hypothetical protein
MLLTAISVPAGPGTFPTASPVLQAQDRLFVGTGYDLDDGSGQRSMIAFDASGKLRWSVPNEQPLIATEDGGFIGQSGIAYDQNGNATRQIDNLLTQSCNGCSWFRSFHPAITP